MYFVLVKVTDKGKETLVDFADCPNELEYHRLQHCYEWFVYAHWINGTRTKIAAVNWSGGASYCFDDPYAENRCCIKEHDHIVPMVRGALFYNHLFKRYQDCQTAKTIAVFPVDA
ncbi:MAG: hypothetical protein WC315_00710 [Candidatus Omnitrophota bacterium]|jgi:hypothetical protein